MVCRRVCLLIYYDLCISCFLITTCTVSARGSLRTPCRTSPSVTSSRGPWSGTGCQTFRTPFRRPICSRSARENRVRPSWCCSGFVLRPPNAIWKSLLGASQMVTNLEAHGALADDTGPERASRRNCSGPKRQPWRSLPDGVEGSSGGRKKHACTSLGWIVEPMIMKNDYPVTIIG